MSIVTELNGIRRRCAVEGLPMPAAHFISEDEVAVVAAELQTLHNGAATSDQKLTLAQVADALLGSGVRFMGCRVGVARLVNA